MWVQPGMMQNNRFMKVIGVTGGVGAGKSLILNFIKENYNSEIILADDLAKSLCLKGERCYKPLVKLLGKTVLDSAKEIDRKKMATMIFESDELRKKVNEIIHPSVKAYIKERIAYLRETEEVDFLVIEAALLIEDGYKAIVDELWYIHADREIRRQRLKESRGYSDEKIESIMSSQLSDEEFMSNSDVCIDNSNSPSDSFAKIIERLGKGNGR